MQYLIKAKVKIKDRIVEMKREIEAENEKMAEEKFKSKIGSEQKIKRSQIRIIEIKKVS
ncbi:MAG: 50S ribosomal protein L18Ae [Candidatus Micrarchaeota archaeon]|nr:50S ribosomal protein L18Ae [Candidatus Micrarchaeota archaeon]